MNNQINLKMNEMGEKISSLEKSLDELIEETNKIGESQIVICM